MPLYDYRCTACGREVEVMHGIYDDGPKTCEYCDGAMRKALSSPAIHFKGKGWAKKDAAAATATKAKPKAGAASDSVKSGDDVKSAGSGAGKTEQSSNAGSESAGKSTSTAGSKTE